MANDLFEYDVVISFAGEDRTTAEEFSTLLRAKKVRVFMDEYQAVEFGGSDFVNHIAELYRTKGRYCVMLISVHYPLKKWTKAERISAQQHALRDADEYIIPLRLDGSEVTGVTEVKGYRDLRDHSLESVVALLEQKLAETQRRSGPPSQSHDLRSGNVPSAEDQP
jgi:hypothetical protein